MNITVFGASGHIGHKLTQKLLDNGHVVTAAFYGHNPFEQQNNLFTKQVDVHDAQAVSAAIQQADVVVSCLGSWGTPTKDILTAWATNVVPAMQQLGKKRIISLTGADALLPNEKPTLLQRGSRLLFGLAAGKILGDGEAHLRLLHDSSLDWTVLRSPVMRDKGVRGQYVLNLKPAKPWESINRNDVIDAMYQQITSDTWNQKAPVIHSR